MILQFIFCQTFKKFEIILWRHNSVLSQANWTIRPNPEGQMVRKPEGGIFNHKAEMIKTEGRIWP